jgi:hypothetical protein
MSDLLISSSLDQEAVSSGDWALELIDTKIQEAIETQNVDILFETIRNLRELAKVTGLALAKILYMMHRNWNVFSDKNDFGDEVFIGTGLHPNTITNYVRIWALFDQKQIPEDLEDDFKQKNIKDLVPIANTLTQGYEITTEYWKELANAPDFNSVSHIIRDKIKEAPHRKNSLRIWLKRDGTIRLYKGSGEVSGGFLDVQSTNPIVQEFIERFIKNMGALNE